MKAAYDFQPYDVLQSRNGNGGTWQDFSTIRDASDARHAVAIIEERGARFGLNVEFRIVRRWDVVYPAPAAVAHMNGGE